MLDTEQFRQFLKVIEACNTLEGEFSGLTLIDQLKRYSTSTKLAIAESKFHESTDKAEKYLEFISASLSRLSYNENNNTDRILELLEPYDSSIDEIETLSIQNYELDSLLENFYYEQEDDILRDEASSLQRHLVNYFKSKYIMEIIDLCKSDDTAQEITTKYNEDIFKSKWAEDAFYLLVEESNLIDANGKGKRGFPAYLSAIWSNVVFTKNIRAYSLTKIKMTEFLNEEFSLNMGASWWGDGTSHKIKVEEVINTIN